jgi:alkylation response protein AidB-like acyl-CoA dehydrogenase
MDCRIDALKLTAQKLRGTSDWNSPLAWRRLMLNVGIPGLDLPEKFGGGGLTAREMAEYFVFCGQIDLDLRDVPGGGHANLILHADQVNARQENILRNVVASTDFVSVAITEDGAGSDIRNIETTATTVDGGYLLEGEKLYVARLEQATYVIVFAKTIPSHYESMTAFVVPLSAEGLYKTNLEAMGLQGVSFGGVTFRKVFVPSELRIGNEGDGFKLFTEHFTYWRVAMAAAAIGCGRGAINQAIEYLRNRQAFGGPIGRFTHLQQELSRHVAHLHSTWLLVLSAMERLDLNQRAYVDAAMAKAEAVEVALDAADWAMRVHGAKGFTQQLDIEKRVRDLYGLRVADGATDVLRGQVAREILGEEIYAMSLGRTISSKKPVTLFPRNFWE